jgi:uncharacterized membrane protein (UPF0136 family)
VSAANNKTWRRAVATPGGDRVFFCAFRVLFPLRCHEQTQTIMNPSKVLWIYIILLVIGGLFGFFKGKSRVSLIMSVVFAALLSLCAARIVFQDYVADILLAALLVVFALRLAKTRKFMPSGLMLVVTIVVLASRHIHL